jgi:hypothetical protein
METSPKKNKGMKYIWISFIILVSVFAACEVWAIQQSNHDAVVEENLLKKVKGVTREGETLRLQTDGGIITFEDHIHAEEGYAKYYLADLLRPAHDYYYLIRAFGYEGSGYRLVYKKTGQTIDLYGIPIFSPDGKRFVDSSLDLDAGHHPNLIKIYNLEDNKYAIEWKHIYKDVKGPANPVWLNNSAIVFFEVTFDKVPTVSNLKKKPYIIERENDKWIGPRSLK